MKILFVLQLALPMLALAAPIQAPLRCDRQSVYLANEPNVASLAKTARPGAPAAAWAAAAVARHEQGKFGERDAAADRALAMLRSEAASPETAKRLSQIAWTYLRFGMCEQADAVYAIGFPMLVSTLGWQDPETLFAISNRTASFHSRRNHAATAALYREAKSTLPASTEYANLYAMFGVGLLNHKDYPEADLALTTAAVLMEQSGSDVPALSGTLFHLASAKYGQLRYTEGEAAYEKARSAARLPAKALTDNPLPQIFGRGGAAAALDYVRAQLAQEKDGIAELEQRLAAIDAAEAKDGAIPGALAESNRLKRLRTLALKKQRVLMLNEAEILHTQGKFADAETAYQILLPQLNDTEIDQLRRIRGNLARLYRANGDLRRAQAANEALLAERLPDDGDEHRHVIDIRIELAEISQELALWDLAAAEREKLAAFFDKFRAGSADQRGNLMTLAELYKKLGREEQLETINRRLSAIGASNSTTRK